MQQKILFNLQIAVHELQYGLRRVIEMIRYNLNQLLAERNLKANKVYVDTGISRSTLSKVINNQSNMIQLETIDKLCQYLNVTPGEFLSYIPVDVKVTTVVNDLHLMDDGGTNIGPDHYKLDLDIFIKFKYIDKQASKDFEYHISNIFNYENNMFSKMNIDVDYENDGYTKKETFGVEINFDEHLKNEILEATNGDYAFSVDIKNLIINSITNEIAKTGYNLAVWVCNYFAF